MKRMKEGKLLTSEKMLVWLNLIMIPVFFVLLGLFSSVSKLKGLVRSDLSLVDFGLFFLVLLIAHELIHGFFFKVFNPKGNVKFGYKTGLFYASSPGSYYGKWQFNLIAVAPFVLISVALIGSYFLNWLSINTFVWLASLHGSACTGDFYYSYLLIKAPKNVKIEDTEKGIYFYQLRSGNGAAG